jgi:hypothetical protein
MPGNRKKSSPKSSTEAAKEAYLQGDISLADALKVPPEGILALRRSLQTLFEKQDWNRCIDVLRGLIALGDHEPQDAYVLAHCHEALGDLAAAQTSRSFGDQLMNAVEGVAP